MNALKVILMIAASCVLVFLVILAVKVIAIIVASKRRSEALLDRIFTGRPTLPMHLALLLIRGKSYAADWKQYRRLRRMAAHIDAEKKRMLKLKAKYEDEKRKPGA